MRHLAEVGGADSTLDKATRDQAQPKGAPRRLRHDTGKRSKNPPCNEFLVASQALTKLYLYLSGSPP